MYCKVEHCVAQTVEQIIVTHFIVTSVFTVVGQV
jgi:hypothetical protein